MTKPYYQDTSVTVWQGDCLERLAEMADNSIDAAITDPPYGLEFMGKDWDGADGFRRSLNAADVGRDNAFGRTSRTSPEYRAGHLFQEWCEAWARECLRVLKPGGHLVAFGGTRTFHRLTCGVEDAGFEIRDAMAYLYGSGFPKSLDVSKAIDKSRRRDYVVAAAKLGLAIPGNNLHDWTKAEHSPGDAWWEKFKSHLSAKDWQQIERAVVGTGASGATAGMQALGPSGIKGGDYHITAPATDAAQQWQGWGTALKPAFEPVVIGRKPLIGTVAGNVLAWGTGAINIDAGRVGSGGQLQWSEPRNMGYHGGSDAGSVPAVENAKGRWPSNVILDESQAAALDQQTGELTSGSGAVKRASGGNADGNRGAAYGAESRPAGTPMISHADTGGASRFFYTAKAGSDERITVDGTAHPTVKPLSIMRYLVPIFTPPGGTVLDLFAGSGTTPEAKYLPMIVQRINRRRDPIAYLRAAGDQLGLFGDDAA